jgi:hypothetical protein
MWRRNPQVIHCIKGLKNIIGMAQTCACKWVLGLTSPNCARHIRRSASSGSTARYSKRRYLFRESKRFRTLHAKNAVLRSRLPSNHSLGQRIPKQHLVKAAYPFRLCWVGQWKGAPPTHERTSEASCWPWFCR